MEDPGGEMYKMRYGWIYMFYTNFECINVDFQNNLS